MPQLERVIGPFNFDAPNGAVVDMRPQVAETIQGRTNEFVEQATILAISRETADQYTILVPSCAANRFVSSIVPPRHYAKIANKPVRPLLKEISIIDEKRGKIPCSDMNVKSLMIYQAPLQVNLWSDN